MRALQFANGKPQRGDENLVAAYLLLHIRSQFGASEVDGTLVHHFIGAAEDAGEWLEDLGLVKDVGMVFEITKAGRILMEADDHHSITRERINKVCEAAQ
jgi:hypothetical protein